VAEAHQHRALEASLAAQSATGVEVGGGGDLGGEPELDRLLGAQPLAKKHSSR